MPPESFPDSEVRNDKGCTAVAEPGTEQVYVHALHAKVNGSSPTPIHIHAHLGRWSVSAMRQAPRISERVRGLPAEKALERPPAPGTGLRVPAER